MAPRFLTEKQEDRLPGGSATPLVLPPRPSQASQLRTDGFTLLEILVVLVLIGVLTSLISLSSVPDPRRAIAEEAQRLGLLLTMASEESRVRQQPISWEGDLHGYRFVTETGGERQLMNDDDLLHERSWQQPLTLLTITQDGQVAQTLLSPEAPPLRIPIAREWVQSRWKIEIADGNADVTVVFDENGIGHVASAPQQ